MGKAASFFVNLFNILIRPNQKYIIFESNDDFCEGTFAFFSYCAKKYDSNKIVWFIKKCNKSKAKLHGAKKVLYIDSNTLFSKLKRAIYSRKCRWYCYSHRFLLNERTINKKAVCLFFSHGTPFKYAPKYTSDARRGSFILANNSFVASIYSNVFGIDNRFIVESYNPRLNNIIYNSCSSNTVFRSILGIPEKSKVILMLCSWSPNKTNYNSMAKDFFPFDDCENESVGRLNKTLQQNNYFLIIKLHPMIRLNTQFTDEKLSNIVLLDNLSFLRTGLSINDLLFNSDALITDYSSVFIDYYLLEKPIYFVKQRFYAEKDKGRIDNVDGGFVFDKPEQYMSGSFINSIEDVGNISIEKDISKFKKDLHRQNIIWNYPIDYDACLKIEQFLLKAEKA